MTALFAVPDGTHLRCVDSADGSSGPLRTYRLADELYPGHAGATSRAYFGMLSPGARAAMLYSRPMARFSELTITDAAELEELMSRVPVDGYAYSEGEYDPATAKPRRARDGAHTAGRLAHPRRAARATQRQTGRVAGAAPLHRGGPGRTAHPAPGAHPARLSTER